MRSAKFRNTVSLLGSILLFTASASLAHADDVPPCLDNNGQALPVDNAGALKLKVDQNFDTPNPSNPSVPPPPRYLVSGPVTAVYEGNATHNHFQINLGPSPDAHHSGYIEVIFSKAFGELPEVTPGMSVVACGDYYISITPEDGFPASPDGAFIHWIHRNPKHGRHQDGFLMIDGTLYGEGSGKPNPTPTEPESWSDFGFISP